MIYLDGASRLLGDGVSLRNRQWQRTLCPARIPCDQQGRERASQGQPCITSEAGAQCVLPRPHVLMLRSAKSIRDSAGRSIGNAPEALDHSATVADTIPQPV
jgi:hypothetical protein